MKYLGFDVSSTTIGWSYFEINNGIIENINCDYISPPKGNEIESLFDLKKELQDTFKIYKKKTDLLISIEEFPFFISKGKGNFNSTARTITKLAIYTRVTALSLYDIFKIEPTFYPVITIRSVLRKISNNKEVKKENVPEVVTSIIKTHSKNEWDFSYVLNKKGKVIKENYDMADSFAVAITNAYKIGELK